MERTSGAKIGPYELILPIGTGGMGEVWKARDTRLDRVVAIKFCRSQFSGRFLREARAVASLNHPNICTLYDIGPDYLVMEFIEGVPPRGPLGPPEAVKLALGIAAALEAAHSKGITHRDLKPANVLVSRSGLKLLDFGLALINDSEVTTAVDAVTKAPLDAPIHPATRAQTDATVSGTVLGTTGYMSPEQAQGKPADARSDIFSFGLVLYELLTGRRAFAGDSAIETIVAIMRDEPAPLRLPGGQDAPPKLAEIVGRCLRKVPAARFQTMREVRAALEEVIAQTASQINPRSNPVSADEIPSIAVLPFANMSGDKEQEYFSDGLAEEILNLLAKIPGLRVIARTSAFAFRGRNEDIRKIAEALGVRTILEGSVRRAGNRIRVTAQLIEAAHGSHLWSERYDRDLTDVFAVQDEIGQAISEALKVRLAPHTQTVNIEAWQNYLKGRYHYLRVTPESLTKAKEHFERALAIEPNFALAYSGLAHYYTLLGVLGMAPGGDVAPLARAAAEKALSIDAANSDAHSVLATPAGIFGYDWKTAETHHHKAIAAEPVPPLVRYDYACFYLHPLGRIHEAVEQIRVALETDPLSVVLHFGMAYSLYFARQYRESIESARRGMEIDPDFYLLWVVTGMAQTQAGDAQEAISSFARVVESAPWYIDGAWFLATACHKAGDRERSTEMVRKLAGVYGHSGAAWYYATAGEADAMFETLEGAYQRRVPQLPTITVEPPFDAYRADPRFQSLLRRVNLA